jgi:hypothetical protein
MLNIHRSFEETHCSYLQSLPYTLTETSCSSETSLNIYYTASQDHSYILKNASCSSETSLNIYYTASQGHPYILKNI